MRFNPLMILWRSSLLILSLTISLLTFPALALITLSGIAFTFLVKHRRLVRQDAYGWSYYSAERPMPRSAYRRKRYGLFG